jgi:O-antigen ligase
MVGTDKIVSVLEKINFGFYTAFLVFSLLSISGAHLSIALGVFISIIIRFIKLYQNKFLENNSISITFRKRISIKKLLETPFLLPFFIFAFGGILGLIFTPITEITPRTAKHGIHWIHLKELALFIIFIWTIDVIKNEKILSKILKLYFWILIPFLFYGILQSYSGIDAGKTIKAFIKNTYHFIIVKEFDLWDSMLVAYYKTRVYRVELIRGTKDAYHIRNFLGHHLSYAGYLIFPIFLYGARIFFWPEKEKILHFIRDKRWHLIIYCIFFILIFYNLFMTQARSVLLGFSVGFILLVFWKKKTATLLVIVFLIIAIFSFKFIHPIAFERMTKRAISQKSNTERLLMWQTAMKYYVQYPLFGIGPGTFEEYYRYELKKLKKSLKKEGKVQNFVLTRHIYRQPHNEFLNQLLIGGPLRLFGFFLLMITPFFWIFKKYQLDLKKIPPEFKYIIIGIICYLIAFNLSSLFQSFFSDDKDQAIFWMTAGWLYSCLKFNKKVLDL